MVLSHEAVSSQAGTRVTCPSVPPVTLGRQLSTLCCALLSWASPASCPAESP